MKNTRVALLSMAAATALTLSACGGGGSDELVEDPAAEGEGGDAAAASGESGGAQDGEYDIALVSKGFQHQFWQAVQSGAEEKAEELGVSITFDGPASETEVDAQLQMLRSAIERQPDAIGYAALDPEACIPLLEQAQEAEIPVVEFDAGCNTDIEKTIAKTDSLAAGALAAEHMAELIDNEGKVAVVAHSQINSTGVERRDGFVNKIEEDYPDIEVVDIQYGDGDHLKSADIAKAMISANPDLKGLYGTNEGSAIGVVNAVNELGMQPGELTIVGFDSGQAQIDAIKSGVMAGLITQDPQGIGRATVDSAVKAIEGEELPEEIDTGSYWVDQSNIDDEDIQAMLYE
ncbi:ABC transporter substrate-binding protein [Ornithinicoccus halotolerans]|uniref:ABC transporter substrate-binding protein n=1 Tax=Ornithinicoccus halotolerans TaxID=1748220 RepID=UPI001297E12E|nr:ABC transporter substrate-binding protein [Ornithinicoccus halotolerans]